MSAGIVAHSGGPGTDLPENGFDGKLFEGREVLGGIHEVIVVAPMVAIVVDFHSAGIDMRFEGRIIIGHGLEGPCGFGGLCPSGNQQACDDPFHFAPPFWWLRSFVSAGHAVDHKIFASAWRVGLHKLYTTTCGDVDQIKSGDARWV